MLQHRSVRWGAAIALLLLIGGISWIYTHPPLQSRGNATMKGEYWRTYAIDLSNEGLWPLRLTGIEVNGEPVTPPHAVAVGSFLRSEIASSIVMRPEEPGAVFETGPVPGWQMLPDRQVGFGRYAIRLLLKPSTPPATIRITYRYLGLPMRLTLGEG